jgi:prepilin-type N-terminal cleavage/methylation domain-containing protein
VKRNREAGLTLIEIMVASAILVIMMSLAWRTISNTSDARRNFEAYEERNHELRMALDRVVRDFEGAYISANEDQSQTYRRTMMIAKPRNPVPSVRFSTLGHRPLWADAHESDQTVIEYMYRTDPDHALQTDWIRREQRRQSNQVPEEEPSDYDILAHDIENVKIEFFNWKTIEWQDTWDTTQSDGQRGYLPTRVRITLTYKTSEGKELKLTTEARVQMQEQLSLSPS